MNRLRVKKARAIPALLITAAVFSALGAVQAGIDWRVDGDVTLADRVDIVRLARKVGIKEPRSVSMGQGFPGGGRFVLVRTRVRVSGQRRTCLSVVMIREDWLIDRAVAHPPAGMRSGLWWTLGHVRREEVWRINDGVWHIDVELGEGVAYADATKIVRAVRHGKLLNAQSALPVGPLAGTMPMLPSIDANRITAIERDTDRPTRLVVTTTNPRDREADALNGEKLYVVIREGRVATVGTAHWVS